jgi:hypothetical protein
MDPKTLARLFRTTALPGHQIASVLRRLDGCPSLSDSFWADLEHDSTMPAPLVDALRFTAKLGELTEHHLPLVRELQRRRGCGEIRSATDLFALDWLSLIHQRASGKRIGTPKDTPGTNAAQRAQNYARGLSDRLASLFPTAALVHALHERAEPQDAPLLRFFDGNPDLDFHRADIDAFLAAHPSALIGIGEADRPAVLERLQGLQRLARLTNGMAQQHAVIRRLADAGLDSAHAIADIDDTRLCELLAPELGGMANAQILHARASHRAAAALALFAKYSPQHNAVRVAAIGQTPSAQAVHSETVQVGSGSAAGGGAGGGGPRIPDWDTLFGSLGRGVCDQSVLSPSAYLVDLLHMLDTLTLEPSDPGATRRPSALELLRERRPDITRIALTGANTDTLLPYVDLVNEVLEGAVFPSEFRITNAVGELIASLDRNELAAALVNAIAGNRWLPSRNATLEVLGQGYKWRVTDDKFHYLVERKEDEHRIEYLDVTVTPVQAHQTLGSAADLRANPEHTDAEVYEALKDKVYPWAVPFDLWAEEARVYLQHLGLPRHALMKLFSPAAPHDLDALLAAEFFGLTPTECKLLCGSKDWSPQELWGFGADDGRWLGTLARMAVFKERAGLSHDELVDLLTARFVNPEGHVMVQRAARDTPEQRVTRAPGNLEDATLQGLDPGSQDRLHRFVRLQRKTGWSIREFDKVLGALGLDAGPAVAPEATWINAEVLVGARDIRVLQQRLGLPLDELLSWFADIDTEPAADASPSLYDRLFHNQSLQGGVMSAFELSGAATARQCSIELNEANRAALCGALQIGLRDVDRLVDEVLGGGIATLDLAALSRLHRATSMRRALRLSVDGFLTLRLLVGAGPDDPTAENATARTLAATRLVAAAQQVAGIGITIEELDYLLCHRIGPSSKLVPDNARIGQWLSALRTGLQRVQEDNQLPETADERSLAELLRLKLGKLEWDDATQIQPVLAALTEGRPLPRTVPSFDATHGAPLANLEAADGATDTVTRMRAVLARLLPQVQRIDSEVLVVRQLGEALGLELGIVQQLLFRPEGAGAHGVGATLLDDAWLSGTTSPDPDLLAAQFQACHWLYKMTLLVQRFRIQSDEIPWLFGTDRLAGLLDLHGLPLVDGESGVDAAAITGRFKGFLGLADLFLVRDRIGTPAMKGLHALRADKDPDTRRKSAHELGTAAGWAADDVQRLVLDSKLLHDWSADALRQFEARLAALKSLGIDAAHAEEWSGAEVTAEAAAAIKQTVKSRHDQQRWLEFAGPLRDGLREKQRATLVAYLVATRRLPDSYALYQHCLIDVDMGPRTMTSRTKLAISAAQLFVQRLLMNLEDYRIPGAQAEHCRKQWQSLKNYRVWEANRKVFLFPENWIEPDLRKDKTALFRDLESELQQGELSAAAAERALGNYLERLAGLAQLDICAIAAESAASGDVLHVFGRTRSSPRAHHYRRREGRLWTSWEALDAGVDAEHLIPVVFGHRLYLFWPEFTAQTASVLRNAKGVKLVTALNTLQTWEHWEIRLAFSEYRLGRWSPRKILQGRLAIDLPPGSRQQDGELHLADEPKPAPLDKDEKRTRSVPARFTFRVEGGDTSVTIRCARCDAEPGPPAYVDQGAFRFTADERLEALQAQAVAGVSPLAEHFHHEGMALVPDSAGSPLALQDKTVLMQMTPRRRILNPGKDPQYLARGVRLVHPPQAPAPGRPTVFVYQDDDRSLLMTVESSHAVDVENIYHPATGELLRCLHRDGLRGLLQREQQQRTDETVLFRLGGGEQVFFDADQVEEVRRNFVSDQHLAVLNERGWTQLETISLQTLQEGKKWLVTAPEFICTVRAEDGALVVFQTAAQQYGTELTLPEGDVDFRLAAAYAPYNWELFFHAPLLLANGLSKNQRFEEAQAWFHHIFDPTDLSNEDAPQRYWKVQQFFEEARAVNPPIVELLELAGYGGADRALAERKRDLASQVAHWQAQPFDPHVIARFRISAYQKAVVMKYIDNLIAWADQLFRQDTIESINEATLLYVLAAEILGQRPLVVPAPRDDPSLSFEGLQAKTSTHADPFIRLEDLLSETTPASVDGGAIVDRTLRQYFCVPGNDKLLGYWDLVADRLNKIRHSQNIEGTERQLALFEPPIEPGLLVRAAAAGVDIASALRDISVPLPHYRFKVMLGKALAFCDDVRALGADFLTALERKDAEGLEQLRMHQLGFDLQRQIGQKAIEEAQQQVADLEEARRLVQQQIPALEADITSWRGGKWVGTVGTVFEAGAKVVKSGVEGVKAAGAVSWNRQNDYDTTRSGAQAATERATSRAMPRPGHERVSALLLAQSMYNSASSANSFPTVITGGAGIASPVALMVTGGGQIKSVWENLGKAFETASKVAEIAKEIKEAVEAIQQKIKDAEGKRDAAQANEKRLGKQIAAATLRVEMASLKAKEIEKAAQNAEQIETYMRARFSNVELCGWRVSQLSTLYFQTYQMAYDLAKRAEKAFEHELGELDTNRVRFGHWDSLRKGLLAGEQLHFDLRRMEKGYLDQNRRDHEITRQVSLKDEFTEAFTALQTSGQCNFDLPEALFDRDYPGHYRRRIRSVRLTVAFEGEARPTNVQCTLTLVQSSVRTRATADSYTRRHAQEADARFRDEIGAPQSIVTSSGHDDFGLFVLDPDDPRYLPFEGAGAISSWRLELPQQRWGEATPEDLADVVLQLSYTARDGGATLKDIVRRETSTAPKGTPN